MNPAAIGALMRGDFATSTPGGIEAQEAAGQKSMNARSLLPIDTYETTRAQMESLGFVFGAVVDDLFVECELPAGWTRLATEHSMYTIVFDEKGRKRASIFYKAAFYDRKADMNFYSRFRIDPYYTIAEGIREVRVVDRDDKVLYVAGQHGRDDYDKGRALREDAEAWLKAGYPDWQNPMAYWG